MRRGRYPCVLKEVLKRGYCAKGSVCSVIPGYNQIGRLGVLAIPRVAGTERAMTDYRDFPDSPFLTCGPWNQPPLPFCSSKGPKGLRLGDTGTSTRPNVWNCLSDCLPLSCPHSNRAFSSLLSCNKPLSLLHVVCLLSGIGWQGAPKGTHFAFLFLSLHLGQSCIHGALNPAANWEWSWGPLRKKRTETQDRTISKVP